MTYDTRMHTKRLVGQAEHALAVSRVALRRAEAGEDVVSAARFAGFAAETLNTIAKDISESAMRAP